MDIKKAEIDTIIARYLAQEATPDEIEQLSEWIRQSEDNRREFFSQKDIWHALNPSFEARSINAREAENKVLRRAGIAHEKGGRHGRPARRWAAIAAMAALPLIALTLYLHLKSGAADIPSYTISTAYGYTMETVLPDGTCVWLNANSTLSYPAEFRGSSRDIALHGEAYFHVSADMQHPFTVHTPDMTVTATGTSFNVNAYSRSAEASVTLVDGKVDVTAGSTTHRLRPGEHISIRDGKTDITACSDVAKYCSWRDGILIFDDERLAAICERLEQIHNVEFDIDSAAAMYNFHIILKGESLGEVMDMLRLSAPVSCTAREPDSAGCRQKIRIRKV